MPGGKNPVGSLRKWVESRPERTLKKTEEEREQEVQRQLSDIYQKATGPPSSSKIPRFYFKKPSLDNMLLQQVRREARTRFLQRKSQEILDNEEIEGLWTSLASHLSPPVDGTETINWAGFCQVRDEMPVKARGFFTPSTFFKFTLDEFGRIPIGLFFNYVLRKVSFTQTRISLSLSDIVGDGYLREQDLENYVFELMPLLPRLAGLEESFYPFYVCTAVRKFFFFLDPSRKGRVYIKDMLTSPILAEFFELRDEALSAEVEETNWFSARSALRIYGQYLALDTDHNGMLSPKELARWGNGVLTEVFVKRVFEEFHTYGGEMDYKTFLDFVLAMENKKAPQALVYFWRLLDIQHRGYITISDINYFFRAVSAKMAAVSQEPVNVEDVKDEVFDMVKPAVYDRITLKDLLNSGVGDTVVNILTDFSGFWAYDNREMLVTEDGEGEEPPPPPPPETP